MRGNYFAVSLWYFFTFSAVVSSDFVVIFSSSWQTQRSHGHRSSNSLFARNGVSHCDGPGVGSINYDIPYAALYNRECLASARMNCI